MKDARSTAEDGLSRLARRVSEGKPWGEIVVVSDILLPVVAQAQRKRQIRPKLDLVLNEPTHLPLPIREMAVSRLLQEQEWSTGRVVVEGGEVEYPVGIGSIIRSEPAEHRDVYASLQEIATHRPGEDVAELETVVSPVRFDLCSARGKRIKDLDLANASQPASRGVIFSPDADHQFVQHSRANHGSIT